LLTSSDGTIDVAALRQLIAAIGDSVVVAGDGRLVRVHVHGERPDLAIAAGLRWGRLGEVNVRDLDDQVGQHSAHVADAASPGPSTPPGPERAVVAVAGADGLGLALASLGARVVRPRHGSRPSVGEIAEAILAAGTAEVIVLPNDRDALMAARHAAESTRLVRVEVIPTRNVAEGIAALMAFDPSVPLSGAAQCMAAEAASLRSFSVTTAARDSIVDGQAVSQGQVLALDGGRHILASAGSVEEAVLRALAGFDDFELVTCYMGASCSPEDGQRLRSLIEESGEGRDVEVLPGGQRHEHLLVAVE